MSELELPEHFLDEIRCHRCNSYLVHPPICLLPDGNSICGLCSKSTEEITQRQLTFENFLKKFKYPCKFKQNGCEKILTFEQIKEHEDECVYILHPCPSQTFCNWEGPVNAISPHFLSGHSDLVKEKLECKIQLEETDKNGLAMIIKGDVSTIVKYQYSNASNMIQYHIQHLNTVDTEVAITVSLVDNLQAHNISIKGDSPMLFNKSFYLDFKQVCTIKTLNLNNYLPALNNPDCILFKIDIDGKAKSYATIATHSQSIDDPLLRCYVCSGFLLPPLYCDKQGESPACLFCSQKFKRPVPTEDKLLLDRVSKTKFPCRWRGCEIRKPGLDLPDHELTCLERPIKCKLCLHKDSSVYFVLRKNLVSHIETHGYKICDEDHFSYVINFTVQDKEIGCCAARGDKLMYLTGQRHCINFNYVFSIYSLFYDWPISIEFEHGHCKIRSKAFVLKSKKPSYKYSKLDDAWCYDYMLISRKDLPPCFNDSKPITVSIKL